MSRNAGKYHYGVSWSDEDSQYLGKCVEFPSLSYLADTPLGALNEILLLVADVMEELAESGEPLPEPVPEVYSTSENPSVYYTVEKQPLIEGHIPLAGVWETLGVFRNYDRAFRHAEMVVDAYKPVVIPIKVVTRRFSELS